MVEQNRSGSYTQIVYSPDGAKLGLMSGSTLQKGLVALTGGSLAVYNSSGLAYYRHADWLGSSRFGSTPSRAMYSDGSYGPFGEPYAQAGTSDSSFTGMNQDTVSNLYDFPAREYGTQGRWPSPDPAGISSMDASDPQTLNRYAYVRNSPLTMTDPTGEDGCPFTEIPGGICSGPIYDFGWGTSYTLDGLPVSGSLALGVLGSGAGCIDSCETPVTADNGKIYQIVQTAGPTIYIGPNGEEIGDSGAAELGLPSLGDQAPNIQPAPLSFDDLLDLVSSNNMSTLPDKLVACLAWIESSGNPNAENSSSSASGLMQITTGTTARVLKQYSDNPSFSGFTAGSLYSQQTNPAISIMTGSAYLQMLAFDVWHLGIPGALSHYKPGPNTKKPATKYAKAVKKCEQSK